MFPIDRLHELVEEGFIGSLPEETYTFMGGGGNVEKFKNETGHSLAGGNIYLLYCGHFYDNRWNIASDKGSII